MVIDSTQLARPGLPNDHYSLKGSCCKVDIQSTGLPSLANHKWHKNVNRNRKRDNSRSTPQASSGDICITLKCVNSSFYFRVSMLQWNWRQFAEPKFLEKGVERLEEITVSTCVEGSKGGVPPAVAMERRHSSGLSPWVKKPFRHRLSSRGEGDDAFFVDEPHNLSSTKSRIRLSRGSFGDSNYPQGERGRRTNCDQIWAVTVGSLFFLARAGLPSCPLLVRKIHKERGFRRRKINFVNADDLIRRRLHFQSSLSFGRDGFCDQQTITLAFSQFLNKAPTYILRDHQRLVLCDPKWSFAEKKNQQNFFSLILFPD